MRWVIAALVVLGLTVGIVLMWPSGEPEDPPAADATTTSTSTAVDPSTTSTTEPPSTTSTTFDDGTHVVETVEEAEAILREHYHQWFLGIYEEDLERIRGTVILESQVEAAAEQFGKMEFSEPPSAQGILIADSELLRSDEDCLAVFARLSATFREGASAGVSIFRSVDGAWKFLSSWRDRGDLWEHDCEASL